MSTIILASEFFDSFKVTRPYMGSLTGKKVLLINTASIGEGFELDPARNIKPFEYEGANVVLFDLVEKSENEVRKVLDATDIVYMAGGNTFFLLKHIYACGFPALLKEWLDQGGVYIGSSAGSIIMSPDIEFIAPMDDKTLGDPKNTKGFGYIDFLFLPHVGNDSLGGAADIIMKNEHSVHLKAFNDGQAAVLKGDEIIYLDAD